MPVVGQHKVPTSPDSPRRIDRVLLLTHERPGFLTHAVRALHEASPGLPVQVYDDGSQMADKMVELATMEEQGVRVTRMEHRGFLEAWRFIFAEQAKESKDGVVLMEDDVIVSDGWDRTLLAMAAGAARLGLNPGAMTCLRCHGIPQAELQDLGGVMAYQSMAHGFQLNMVPAWVLGRQDVVDRAIELSRAGRHGFDVWFLGLLSDMLKLTNFISLHSWAAHLGAGNSVVQRQGYKSFDGVGYDLVPGLARKVAEIQVFGTVPVAQLD